MFLSWWMGESYWSWSPCELEALGASIAVDKCAFFILRSDKQVIQASRRLNKQVIQASRRLNDEGRLYFGKLVIHIIGTVAVAQQRFKGLLGSFTKSEIISNYVGVARRVDTQHLNVYKQDAKVPH